MSCGEKCGFLCGLCRIACFSIYECCCCVKPPPELPTYNAICIGLTNGGKTSLLNSLTFSNNDVVIPTVGFAVRDVRFPTAVMNVKELGGGPNIRPYWNKYYSKVHAVIFVIDVTNYTEAKTTLHEVLSDDKLRGKPWMVLLNKVDLVDDCNINNIIEEMELENAMKTETLEMKTSSKNEKDELRETFEGFVATINDFYSFSQSSNRI